ncbi:hypothetical protein SAMN02745129_0818 [Ferrimonas marina]|uniref:Uncharacterized protein n=1 Tax=Ferrimonas marina TaxID=299255 RepID=A0A1M5MYC1_9GAMM|nr:hypothetical protein SAMN02745129_0818 [Ferrimonas marina]
MRTACAGSRYARPLLGALRCHQETVVQLSRLLLLLTLYVPLSNSAEVNVFANSIEIPDNCKLVVRASDDFSYSCPTNDYTRNTVGFHTKSDNKVGISNVISSQSSDSDGNMEYLRHEERVIDKFAHNVVVLSLAGHEVSLYSVCNDELCLSVMSSDKHFITNIVEQLSEELIGW